jgi:hypothetical protein
MSRCLFRHRQFYWGMLQGFLRAELQTRVVERPPGSSTTQHELLVPSGRSKYVPRVKQWVSWAVQPWAAKVAVEGGGVQEGSSAEAPRQDEALVIEGLVLLGETHLPWGESCRALCIVCKHPTCVVSVSYCKW